MNHSTKTIVAIVGLLAVLVLGFQTRAQMSGPTSTAAPVAILVQNPQQLPVVLRTAGEMHAGSPDMPARDVHVIVCGRAVEGLAAGNEHEALLEETTAAGVRVAACGISLDKVEMSPDSLVEGVDTVQNGLTEMVKLADDGAVTLPL